MNCSCQRLLLASLEENTGWKEFSCAAIPLADIGHNLGLSNSTACFFCSFKPPSWVCKTYCTQKPPNVFKEDLFSICIFSCIKESDENTHTPLLKSLEVSSEKNKSMQNETEKEEATLVKGLWRNRTSAHRNSKRLR